MGYKRPRGEMTPEERDWARRRERKAAYLRQVGRPIQVDPAPAIAHVRHLRSLGMTARQMAEQSRLSANTFNDLARGRRTVDKGGQPIKVIDRADLEEVLRVRFEPPNGYGAIVDSTGARRRLQALGAIGFGGRFQAAELGVAVQRVHYWITVDRPMASASVGRICEVYDKYADADPYDLGLTPYSVNRAKGDAVRRGHAPPSCWDADTIDDPDAIPEWTGQCGTVFGWRIHETQGIPLCQPCADARGSSDVRLSGEKLRQARVRRGLSQLQLAAEAGIKPDSYRSWETGRTQPRFQKDLDQVLGVLDVTYDQVVE